MLDISKGGPQLGVQERREREKREQRQKILNAALQIITKEGYAALSMRRLAEQIEYSPASIYLHFGSREQIAKELSEVGFGELLQQLSAASALPNAVHALHALGLAYVRYGMENREMYRLIFMGDSEYMIAAFSKQTEASAGIKAYRLLIDLATRLQKAGVMKDAATVEFAELIGMALHGIVSLQITCIGLQLASPEKLARLATEMLSAAPGLVPEKA